MHTALWRTYRRRALPALATLCAALLCGGCGSHGHTGRGTRDTTKEGHHEATATRAAKPATLQQIAKAIGCEAEVTVDADELREGACTTKQGAYRMATFAADEGQRAWLTESQDYGGIYLVGNRWVVTAQTADSLSSLRGNLGGTIESGESHHGSAPPRT